MRELFGWNGTAEDDGTGSRPGFIYILTNSAMPGLVKIGRTDRHPLLRAAELASTGVPVPYEVYHYWASKDSVATERQVHQTLAEYRATDKREFFQLRPLEARKLVEQLLGPPLTSKEHGAALGKCPACGQPVSDAAPVGIWDGSPTSELPGGDILAALCDFCGLALESYAAAGAAPADTTWTVARRKRRPPDPGAWGPPAGWQADGAMVIRRTGGIGPQRPRILVTWIKASDTGRVLVRQWVEDLFEREDEEAPAIELWGEPARKVKALLDLNRGLELSEETQTSIVAIVADYRETQRKKKQS